MIYRFDDPAKFLRAVLAKIESGSSLYRKVDYATLSMISRSGVLKRCKNSKTVHIYHHAMIAVVVVDKVNSK